MLNVCIILGSVLFRDLILQPSIGHYVYSILWLLPAYSLSLLFNMIWYTDIARRTVHQRQRLLLQTLAEKDGQIRPTTPEIAQVSRNESIIQLVSQELFRIAFLCACMCTIVSIESVQSYFIVRPIISLILWSWLYAFYCFDYKWQLHGVPFSTRIYFYEQHWAYFLGFGSVTLLPMLLFSFFKGAAIGALMFSSWVIVACDSDPKGACAHVLKALKDRGMDAVQTRMPIFWVPTNILNFMLSFLSRRHNNR